MEATEESLFLKQRS